MLTLMNLFPISCIIIISRSAKKQNGIICLLVSLATFAIIWTIKKKKILKFFFLYKEKLLSKWYPLGFKGGTTTTTPGRRM